MGRYWEALAAIKRAGVAVGSHTGNMTGTMNTKRVDDEEARFKNGLMRTYNIAEMTLPSASKPLEWLLCDFVMQYAQ